MHIYSIEEGTQLVKAARNAIELYIKNPHFDKKHIQESLRNFADYYGVFVTLEYYPLNTLRGCIGYPNAVGPIKNSLVEAAIGAAFEDPRFNPLSIKELDDITVEVSILSKPEELPKDYKKRIESIKIGRDGLIVEFGFYSGLLLPIVPVEEKWDKEKFFQETCIKAGLPEGYWRRADVKLFKFETQIFKEEEPNGKIKEIKLEEGL
ncbi:MAG: TIGR00296 family protein [Candidatus Micrarchaeia archaeon]